MPRVLVAIVTYEEEEQYLAALLEALQAQSEQDFDLLFVDNTIDSDGGFAYVERLKEILPRFFPEGRWHVLHVDGGEERFQRILKSRQAARAFFLERDYGWLWWLDSDVIPPKDALKKLMDAKKELITGVYFIGKEIDGKGEVIPCILLDVDGELARQATVYDVLSKEVFPVGAAGLGCTLVSRRVIEQIGLRLNPHGKGEDIMFYRDAAALGIMPFACSSVRCQHLMFPFGDPRNARYDAARYLLR